MGPQHEQQYNQQKQNNNNNVNNYKDEGKENRYPSDEFINFQDKVDALLEKEEELIAAHMNLIKENASLLTKEGELISYVQENDEYEIEDYVTKMDQIIMKKLKAYEYLQTKIMDFKQHLKAEEEAHNMTIAKGWVKQ